MRVFMLGWEFPPYISGGLGTACHGLTHALAGQGVRISFVLPRPISPVGGPEHLQVLPKLGNAQPLIMPPEQMPEPARPEWLEKISFHAVPAGFTGPYARPGASAGAPRSTTEPAPQALASGHSAELGPEPIRPLPGEMAYQGDLLVESQRYARLCVELARGQSFDVVHAHDWLTFPAGMAVAAITGKPLVVHVHSTEFDRAGEHVDPHIYEIERQGVHAARRVVAVSHLTGSILEHRYDLDPERIRVVYNGIDDEPDAPAPMPQAERIRAGDRIVLFLGRVTMQKGPEYFVAAAKKVLEKQENVKFIIAGSGDKAAELIERAAQEGIGHKVLFTGFLRGDDVDRIFRMADVYVMPSVSEPFGIAALEAIRRDVPVILSRNSGVSEVIRHALKVEFWDVDDIADKILAVLRHRPLANELTANAEIEVGTLRWADAAERCRAIYDEVASPAPRGLS